jgi:hypothetical protein
MKMVNIRVVEKYFLTSSAPQPIIIFSMGILHS